MSHFGNEYTIIEYMEVQLIHTAGNWRFGAMAGVARPKKVCNFAA